MDTKQVVSELLATGLTQQELADLIGCSQATINAFLNGNRGARPSFSIGQPLLALHAERCKPQKQNRSHDTPEQLRELEPAEMRMSDRKVAE